MGKVIRYLLYTTGLSALFVVMSTLPAQQRDVTKIRYSISYCTYLGGSEYEQAREIIVYPDGSVLVGAQTYSTDMPTTEGVVQPRYAGGPKSDARGGDCHFARISADGKKLLAATYFGGSSQERNVYGMALDKQGNVVITSMTRSPDAPTTKGSFQPKYGGGPSDWLVAKLSGDLKTALWCTYIGGSDTEFPRGGLCLDKDDNVFVVGGSASPNFPTTAGVVQQKLRGTHDTAVVKLKPDGSGLVFSTLLGGSGQSGHIVGVRLDKAGDIYVAGHTQCPDFPVTAGAAQPKIGGQSDCFLSKLSADGSKLLYSTFLGGSRNEFPEHAPYLCPDGTVLLTGAAGSQDFPTTDGAFQRVLKGETDGFLMKLSADGQRFVFSTLLGGAGGDFCLMPTPDSQGNIFICGITGSRDFPVTPNALQKTYGGGPNDGVLAVLSSDGSRLLYATYLGGNGDEMVRSLALGPNGEVYLVGNTASTNFPVTAEAMQAKYGGGTGDAFVVKLVPVGT